MSTPEKKPKGILKKSVPISPSASDAQALAVATQHARIIHNRRELLDVISDSIIFLAKLPLDRSPSLTASRPSPADAAAFKSHVRLFQPGDYDDLIEERNVNRLCGYALCDRPRMRVPHGGEFKLVNYGRKDFSIVPKAEIERWCSQACARRAMYVKVQLNETAAWERAGIDSIEIDLYEEPKKTDEEDAAARLASDLAGLKIEAERKATKDARELALERGDTGEKKGKRTVAVKIKENDVTGEAEVPSLGLNERGHLVLEGYETKFDSQSHKTTE